MKKEKTSSKGRASGLVIALYVIAAILMAVWIYMIIVNVIYINNYAASYGISVSDMKMDAFQYVVTGSISYFVYGLLVFCAGKLIRLMQVCRTEVAAAFKHEREQKEIAVNAPVASEDAVEETEVIEDEANGAK